MINTGKILGVIGSRNFTNKSLVQAEILKHRPKELVSGGAMSVDQYAQDFAKEFGLKITIFYPNYGGRGKTAPLERNSQIVDYCEELVAFVLDKSRGSMDTVEKARKAGKKVYLHEFSSKAEESDGFGF